MDFIADLSEYSAAVEFDPGCLVGMNKLAASPHHDNAMRQNIEQDTEFICARIR
ncbi:hypothetical protein GCM10011496_24290 [Polaromonas eurypsychrophila]|uniref:Uncharacterized protein n=1 Tax=Polaromonas eurypsychrophila TaxID=1614635 RepID=A0A916SIY3_9BURK|nr:hypothetical protein GCM10011496_24290 [Polaromonas eurypsychrophila]